MVLRRVWFHIFVMASVLPGLPVRAAEPARHIDLERYYFASAEQEVTDRQALDGLLADLDKQRGGLGGSAAALLQALRLDDRIRQSYARHDAYLLLRCRGNRAEGGFCGDMDALEAKVDGGTAFVDIELAALAPDALEAFLRDEPALRPYRFRIASAQRRRPHLLPAPQREALSTFQPEISGWQGDLYDTAVADADFGTVQSARGPLDVRRQRNLIAADPDPEVRRQGFLKRYAGLAGVREVAAFALLHTAAAGNRVARLRGFAGAPDARYFDLGLDPQQARAAIERVAAQGELGKRFERLRAAEVERGTGLAQARPWDRDVPLTALPELPLQQAVGLFHEVFAPLGTWYQQAFDALLDPANGRFDIVPGGAPHRAGGGFSVGYAGAQSALFVGTYDGTYKDLSVIVHEGGHAVHRALMNAHGVAPAYTTGPHFMFESFAEFNELLLADDLAARAADPAARRYYAERFLAVKGLDFLYGAQDALLEQAVYDGSPASADDLDRLTVQIDSRFSIWPQREPALKARWEAMSLAYEDPLYSVNYMVASLLALEYYRLYRQKPEWFLPRYRALLENGFDDTPQHLLQRTLGIDLDGPGLLDDAAALVDRRLKALEQQ